MICATCGTANEAGRKFCGECGSALASPCPRCGTSNAPAVKFCGECGLDLRAGGTDTGAAPAPGLASHATERRLVSVLFVDLVGFTTASEQRDAEDTREFLGRYFETARTIIERYGGTVEKFIGDAVMAVWGAPTAHEDDAERAVRAALDLVGAVPALDEPSGTRARGGVLTGEAAVSVGAIGQGLVTGDLVNTASRLQSAALPGSVYVGEATYRAAAKSITFEPVGEQELKGKSAPVAIWRATGVASRRGGDGRSSGVEPPFVGRDDELRLLKDLFHATERERKARLVSVIGQGGIGKSRLAWELEKYLDGLVGTAYWHAGRSPAYGEGISYWALAEMVRQRATIAETDDEATALDKLRAIVTEWVPDAAERGWIEPRLAGLLALAPMPPGTRNELFAAWRTFFERIAAQGPTVLLFEDVQWADQGMLDFIEHLLDAARQLPFFVITLARPELLERRPGWGSGVRSVTTMQLEPLARPVVEAMIRGLIPDIPHPALSAILDRSEGIPLYAVETLRMLVDRGQLERAANGDHWKLTGTLDQLAVPETLQALIAARLDALEPSERTLLQQAAILGQSFTLAGVAAVAGADPEEVEPRLAALVRRDFLVHEMNPRSPERGQYQFVQGIVREVAHGSLARADRRALHLAAARFFESLGEDELAGVLASHYMDAHAATTPGPEADALAAQARIALRAAADRAIALHAYDNGLTYLEQAIAITAIPADRAALEERAADAAANGNRYAVAVAHAEAAIEIMRATGDRQGLLRARSARGSVEMSQHRDRTAVTMLREALDEAADLPPSFERAEAESQLARALMIQGSPEAVEWADRVLASPAAIDHPELVLQTLITKAPALQGLKRWKETEIILRGAIAVAEADGDMQAMLRARNNISGILSMDDLRTGQANAIEAYQVAARIGARTWTGQFLGLILGDALELGDFDAWVDTMLEETAGSRDFYRAWALSEVGQRKALRGEPAEGRRLLAEAMQLAADSGQAETGLGGALAMIDVMEGRYLEGFDRLRATLDAEQDSINARWAIVAALMAGTAEHVAELATRMPTLQITGRQRLACEAALSAGITLLHVAVPHAAAAEGDARGQVMQTLELADACGLLLWRAFLGMAFGRLGDGRFPEAAAIRAEGEEFLRSRGAGSVVDAFAASLAGAPAPVRVDPAVRPVADEVPSER